VGKGKGGGEGGMGYGRVGLMGNVLECEEKEGMVEV
jgi:hypothetical protein